MIRRFKVGVLLMLGTYILGAVGYKLESPQTDFLDCLYMSVITVASVGFTEVIDVNQGPHIRGYTILLIIVGVAVQLYAVSVVTAFIVEGDLNRYFVNRRMNRMAQAMTDHYVVCGAGETGLRVIDELVRTDRKFVAIDLKAEAIEHVRQFQKAVALEGSADDEEVLEAAGIRRAKAAAVALGNDRDNLVATLTIRNMNTSIRIVVKEVEPGMAARFRRAGADAIINPATIGGLRLVSEMVRPSVVSFLDQMMRDTNAAYRVEEIPIGPGSAWENRPLLDLGLRRDFNLIVAGVRLKDSGGFAYNPDDDWRVEAGQTLIVLGSASDAARARSMA